MKTLLILLILFIQHYYQYICSSTLKSNIFPNHPSFLQGKYSVEQMQSSPIDNNNNYYCNDNEFLIRQVPGDGGCLFHALSVSLVYVVTKKHVDFDSNLRKLSNKLRKISIDILNKTNQLLVLENNITISSNELLAITADHYNLSTSDYCKQMLDSKTWGGGPEIVAISNYFQRPIHVYELTTNTNRFNLLKIFNKKCFKLKLCAKLGSPAFDSKEPLRILCADGRFPNIKPGFQKPIGDHFLALYPTNKFNNVDYNDRKLNIPIDLIINNELK